MWEGISEVLHRIAATGCCYSGLAVALCIPRNEAGKEGRNVTSIRLTTTAYLGDGTALPLSFRLCIHVQYPAPVALFDEHRRTGSKTVEGCWPDGK